MQLLQTGTAEQKQQMIQQIMTLTPQQIESLPDPAQRQQIIQLQLQMVCVCSLFQLLNVF